MKKLLTISMFVLLIGFGFNFSVKAEDIIDLYPYDQEACLDATTECTYTKVGNSHWSFTYYGHKYYVIKDLVRYASEMEDTNSDGFIEDAELAGIPYNAFASMTINNTAAEVIITTANARTDITDVVHRKYAHFDENGNLAMFEDHISTYYIFNDGTALLPDWRLATEAEATAYDAADPKPDTTRLTHIRIALDDVDSDGYVVEPLSYLKWTNADVDTTVETDVTKWSTIIADDPNNLYIPAGWTVVSFGTNDRGALNPATRDYIESLPAALVDDTVLPMVKEYVDQPAMFHNLSSLDDDAGTAGINIVVDYNGTFELSDAVTADWVDMFDDTGAIIHETEMLDFSVELSDETGVLETINYVWNETNSEYDASAAQTVIDSSIFGKGYTAKYMVTTPESDVTEVVADIVIGVMPPKFMDVEDRYIDQGIYIDLMEGITADDGYGNDITDTIMVTMPADFNMYNPLPGMYTIDLEFTHHVHFDGIPAELVINGVDQTWDGVLNPTAPINANSGKFMVYTDATVFAAAGSGWGSVMVLVGADGLVDEQYDRYDWSFTDSTGTVTGDADLFAAWQAAVVIEDGGYVVAAHGTPNGQTLRDTNLPYDAPISIVIPVPDFDYDIVVNDSYMVTVDDTMAPVALVLNDEYMITEGDYMTADDAILANVAAFDFTDSSDDLAIYVSSNGGLLVDTAGTYTVEVTVEDIAGNSAIVEFDVVVMAAPDMFTEAEAQAMVDAALLAADFYTDADVQALLDAQTLTAAEIQALIDDATAVPADTGCGSAIGIGSVVTLMVAILGGGVIFFVRKNH